MGKASKKRCKSWKKKKEENLHLYCPVCQKDDKLVEDPDIPQISQCKRCAIHFSVEDSDETDWEDADVVYMSPQPKIVESLDPIVGAMVEL